MAGPMFSTPTQPYTLTLLPFVPPRRYLRLFNLRNCYYAGSRFLDHVDNDRFDPCPWRFHPLFFFSHSNVECRPPRAEELSKRAKKL